MTPKRRTQVVPDPHHEGMVARLGKWMSDLPRIVRILLVGLFALAVTLAFSPLIDLIYDRYFFSPQTLIVPALVTTAIGLMMYLLGWWLMVGTVGERPEARAAMLWYFGVGIVAIVVVAYLIISGVSLLNFEA